MSDIKKWEERWAHGKSTVYESWEKAVNAEIKELRARVAALKGQQGDPVAWVSTPTLRELKKDELDWAAAWNAPTGPDPVALYTRSQPTGAREAQPMTKEQIAAIWAPHYSDPFCDYRDFARAVEAHHGIKGARE